MGSIGNTVFDDGLSAITSNAENIHILTQDPGLDFANIALYAVGAKASPAIAAPSDRTEGGREVIVAIITDGLGSAVGDATHYAITDDSASDVLVSGTLSSTISVTSGSAFALESFTVGIPDPA